MMPKLKLYPLDTDKVVPFNQICGENTTLLSYQIGEKEVDEAFKQKNKEGLKTAIEDLREVEKWLLGTGRIKDFGKINFSRNLIKAYNGILENFERETIEKVITQLQGIFLVVNTLRGSKNIESKEMG